LTYFIVTTFLHTTFAMMHTTLSHVQTIVYKLCILTL